MRGSYLPWGSSATPGRQGRPAWGRTPEGMRSKALLITVALTLSAVVGVPAPVSADVPLTVLGTDPALDGPPGADLTQLAAGVHGTDLHIQFKFANSIPVLGTHGPLAGVEWLFKSEGKTYLAEAYPNLPNATTFGYILFEIKADSFEQIATLEGNWDTVGGVLDIFVPLKTIGAKKGTKIAGAGPDDADVHIHGLVTTIYPDKMTTKKGIVVR